MSFERLNTPKSGFRKFFQSLDEWFEYKDKGKWIEDMKGSIILAASMIATMTFSLGTNPPGGIVSVSLENVSSFESFDELCSNVTGICAGSAILGSLYTNTYVRFLVCNTICFIAAISVIFLLVSGIPMDNTFSIWLLSTCMCITLTSLALTYMVAAVMITPDSILNNYDNPFAIALLVWVAFVLLVHGVHIVRFLVRKICRKCLK
ncbi:uncharacterized protein LOC123884859 [Trifolium pratense]|uniref:uncharacterized protein LOC123884859 n=1 Tax=Trifolium pratense TaxID=57577 RepID=UPI001E6968F7|nr:uncharacterized protein LOC123884859 [Trifolium pratense]